VSISVFINENLGGRVTGFLPNSIISTEEARMLSWNMKPTSTIKLEVQDDK
jgi:hypothetical protein